MNDTAQILRTLQSTKYFFLERVFYSTPKTMKHKENKMISPDQD